jgi:hypothetical protein
MKSLLVLAAVLSNVAIAKTVAPQCFVAKNPETITATISDANGENGKDEAVVNAKLKLSKNPNEETRYADLKVKTNTGKKIVVGAFNSSGDTDKTRYAVECDGGSMTVVAVSKTEVKIVSDYIRGDIEGCDGIASIKTAGSIFEKVDCKK